jgi:hypothetical protein
VRQFSYVKFDRLVEAIDNVVHAGDFADTRTIVGHQCDHDLPA